MHFIIRKRTLIRIILKRNNVASIFHCGFKGIHPLELMFLAILYRHYPT